MSVKDILALIGATSDDHVLSFTEQMWTQYTPAVAVAVVGQTSLTPYYSESWATDPNWEDETLVAQKSHDRLRQSVIDRMARSIPGARVETTLQDANTVRRFVSMRSRYVDLTIVGQPGPGRSDVHIPLVEAALLASGRPVMTVPSGWTASAIGRRIAVCWNASAEASRAVAGAMAILTASNRVHVLTADTASGRSRNNEPPDSEIALHLRRHGCQTEFRTLDAGRHPEAEVILRAAHDAGADLIVMGGYGRSRLSEVVFGGVTRDMLANSDLPLLMSH